MSTQLSIARTSPKFVPYFLILAAGSIAFGAENWPMYLRDLSHTSYNQAESVLALPSIQNLQTKWKYNTNGGRLAAAVSVSGGAIFFGDWNGDFHALSAIDGTSLWTTAIGKSPVPQDPTCGGSLGVSSQASVLDNIVYVGGGDAAAYALDATTGRQLWRTSLADPATGAYIWSSPMLYGQSLYYGVSSLGDCPIARGAVVRLDAKSGNKAATKFFVPEGDTGAGVWSTPAISADGKVLFVTTANGDRQDYAAGYVAGAVLRMDPETLALGSHYLLPENDTLTDLIGGSSPTLFSDASGTPMLGVAQKNGILYAFRQSDLSLAWQVRLAVSCINPVSGCGSISTPSFDGKTLYAAGGVRDPNSFFSGTVYAIDPTTGNALWVRDLFRSVVAPTTVANGLLYVSTTGGLQIYDSATGQTVWSDNDKGAIFSQPVVVDGVVYAAYRSGELSALTLSADTAKVLYTSSSASGLPSVAPGSLASIYGSGLLRAGITLTDRNGVRQAARVLASFAGQVNFIVPQGGTGLYSISANRESGDPLTGSIQVSDVAPGLFSANADGKGVAAAQVLLLKANGTQQLSAVFQCGSTAGSCTTAPIDLGNAGDRAFLILYGTGLRGRTATEKVTVTIGGVQLPASYAGPQPVFDGLDQLNVEVPSQLRGKGQSDLFISVDDQRSNVLNLNIR